MRACRTGPSPGRRRARRAPFRPGARSARSGRLRSAPRRSDPPPPRSPRTETRRCSACTDSASGRRRGPQRSRRPPHAGTRRGGRSRDGAPRADDTCRAPTARPAGEQHARSPWGASGSTQSRSVTPTGLNPAPIDLVSATAESTPPLMATTMRPGTASSRALRDRGGQRRVQGVDREVGARPRRIRRRDALVAGRAARRGRRRAGRAPRPAGRPAPPPRSRVGRRTSGGGRRRRGRASTRIPIRTASPQAGFPAAPWSGAGARVAGPGVREREVDAGRGVHRAEGYVRTACRCRRSAGSPRHRSGCCPSAACSRSGPSRGRCPRR